MTFSCHGWRGASATNDYCESFAASCLIEAVRSAHKTIDIDNVNRVLLQPHWQKETDLVDFRPKASSRQPAAINAKLSAVSRQLSARQVAKTCSG